jgi:hypothetical protein
MSDHGVNRAVSVHSGGEISIRVLGGGPRVSRVPFLTDCLVCASARNICREAVSSHHHRTGISTIVVPTSATLEIKVTQ